MNAIVRETTDACPAAGPPAASASAGCDQPGRRGAGVEIVIAFHRNEGLVGRLTDSLLACAAEWRALHASVVAVNDSPGYEPLAAALDEARRRLEAEAIPFALVTNASNLGFIGSANVGLARARATGRDAVLLNSDTEVFPGAIAEMVRVASLDHRIGFVNPRSNNATIASLPTAEGCRHRSPTQSYEAFRRLMPHLPDHHRVPTCVGFCMLIRHEILMRFGLLDESFGAGYCEENDLVMRAARHGYRAVLANRAFVYHQGNASFGPVARQELESRNSRLLAERYPEYRREVRDFLDGPVHRAERMLAGVLPDAGGRFDVLLDLSDIVGGDAATASVRLLRELASRHAAAFNLFAMMPGGNAVGRDIATIAGVEAVPTDTARTFAVGLRIGPPPTGEGFRRLNRLAVRTAWLMIDTAPRDRRDADPGDLDWACGQVREHGDCLVREDALPGADVASGSPRWGVFADELAVTMKELLGRPNAFDPLVRRIATVGTSLSSASENGARRPGLGGPAGGRPRPHGPRRTAAVIGPLRLIRHLLSRCSGHHRRGGGSVAGRHD